MGKEAENNHRYSAYDGDNISDAGYGSLSGFQLKPMRSNAFYALM